MDAAARRPWTGLSRTVAVALPHGRISTLYGWARQTVALLSSCRIGARFAASQIHETKPPPPLGQAWAAGGDLAGLLVGNLVGRDGRRGGGLRLLKKRWHQWLTNRVRIVFFLSKGPTKIDGCNATTTGHAPSTLSTSYTPDDVTLMAYAPASDGSSPVT